MNKMKDLSILKRAAMMLTGTGRVAAVLLVMILTMTAQMAWAAVTYQWNDDTKTLTFSGSGEITFYLVENSGHRDEVVTAVIGSGVTSIYAAFNNCSNLATVTFEEGSQLTSIGVGAFANCTGLTSIAIPNSVTSIGESAFFDCENLTSVIIPASVTSIGQSAFKMCSNLAIVVVQRYQSSGESPITTLVDDAFWGCGALANIYVPNDALDAYKNASNWSQYEEKIQAINGDSNSGYCGDFNVNDGKNVKYIYYHLDNDFGNGKDILIILGSGAMKDGAQPWLGYWNEKITTVNIGYGVTSVGGAAFNACSNMTSVTIPSSVTSIGERAFEGCGGLTSVSIPNSVTSIGDNVFNGCGKLESINVDGNNQNYTSEDGVLFNKDKTTLIRYPQGKSGTSYEIPASVTSIGGNAFNGCSNLTSIVIPNSVTSIGNNAFDGCSNLTSIAIPANVTNIGNGAFRDCSRLVIVVVQRYHSSGESPITALGAGAFGGHELLTIYVPNNDALDAYKDADNWSQYYSTNKIKAINGDSNSGYCGVNNGMNVYYAYCQVLSDGFLIIAGSGAMKDYYDTRNRPWSESPGNIKTVNIGDGVTSIGVNAFNGCGGLTSITIPASMTNIGEKVFCNCSKLTSITIPASVTSIGENAFYGCGKLESINVDVNNQNYASEDGVLFNKDKTTLIRYPQGKSGTSYEILASVTTIGNDAFNGCGNLTSIIIPASVTSIGNNAFNGCSGLTSISIPASVTSIGSNAFKNTGWYKNQPNSLLYLNNWLLGYKGSMPTGTLQINEGTKGITGSAFSNCDGLTSITIPASMTSIGNWAFSYCTGLTSLTIPANVTSIGDYAFQNCTGLTSVTIGSGVTSIGERAFVCCSNLANVYCFADPTKLTWGDSDTDFITEYSSDPNYKTKCHVFKESAWDGFKSTVNVTFVGDLGSITCPVELTEATGVDLLTSLAGRTDITAPLNVSFKRTFTSGVASTVCLPFDFTPTGGTYYVFHSVDKSTSPWTVTMAEADPDNCAQTDANGHLLANTPYLFMPAADGEVTFSGIIATVASSYTAGSVTKAATNADGTNDAAHEWQFKGTFVLRTWYDADPGNIYAFSANQITATDGVSTIHAGDFFRISGGDKSRLRPFRACMEYVTKTSQARGVSRTSADNEVLPDKMIVRLIGLEGTPTQIGTLDTHTGEVTFDDDAWYSLDGRKLSAKPTKKGIYIHSGKTVVVK